MAKLDQRDWKRPDFDGLCPTVADWARMAAYIDGEGSVLINPRRGSEGGRYSSEASTFYLKVTVANTDVRLPVWCKETFGGTYKDANTEKYYEGHNWKRAYHWSACSNRAAWILFNCASYFVMKGEQALIGVRLQESMSFANRGRSLPKSVVEERRELKQKLLVLKQKGRQAQIEQEARNQHFAA